MPGARLVAAGMLVVFGVLGGWRSLAAQQQVTGTVRDSTSRLAIAGAVITAFSRDGAVLSTALTNERGSYRLLTAGTLPTRVRVVRLGFRPVEAEMPAARTEIVQLDLVMLRIPYELQPVRVAAGANCPRRSDRRAALALLEQARAGLLATVVARSDKAARMKRLMIERRLDPRTGRVTRHHVTIDSISRGISAFGAARGARDFVRDGFTEPDSVGGAVFFAPDADVLLDDDFAAGYCFHIMERNRARPNQVGLGFKAADRKRDRVDVDGALWIDTVARALVDLEFRYVGLDRRLEDHDPGGRVAFREMVNGVALIDRWLLRLVGEEPTHASAQPEARRVIRRTPAAVPLAVAETGGELARAVWQDGHAWNGSLGTMRLRITTDGGQPSVGTLVRLDDTDYQATSDSSGRLEIVDLAPGPYSARIVDPQLEPIGITLATDLAFDAARDSVVERDVTARTARQYVAQRCEALRPPNAKPESSMVSGSAWVIGRIVGPDRKSLDDVQWAIGRAPPDDSDDMASGKTGNDGIFAFCRANLREDVVIRFRRKGMAPGFVTRFLAEQLTVIHAQMSEEKKR